MYRNLIRSFLPLCLAVVLAGAAGSARAAKWEIAPRVSMGATYNDNYSLQTDNANKEEVAGAEVDAELAFSKRGPRTEFEFAPRVNSTLFPDDKDSESTDYFLSLNWQHRTQRATFRLRGDYSRESIVESELLRADLPGVDLGEGVGGDGGRISVRTDRDLLWLRPSYTYQWSERTRLEAGLVMYDADFDRVIVGGQIPFTDVSGQLGLAFRTSPTGQLAVRAIASKYEPDIDQGVDTDRIGGELQWTRRRSERTQFYLRAGARRSEFSGALSLSATGFTGGIGGTWRGEVSQVLVDLLRSVEPSAVGRVVNRDELRLRLERRTGPRTALFAGLRGVRTETSIDEGGVSLSDRDYVDASLGFEWRVRRAWSLRGEYGFRWQEFEADTSDASSHGVRLRVVYEPRRQN